VSTENPVRTRVVAWGSNCVAVACIMSNGPWQSWTVLLPSNGVTPVPRRFWGRHTVILLSTLTQESGLEAAVGGVRHTVPVLVHATRCVSAQGQGIRWPAESGTIIEPRFAPPRPRKTDGHCHRLYY
jgi:hypothetical protein